MSMIVQAMRPHRIRRFAEVLRTEGPGRAINRARTHLRLLSSGQGEGEVSAASAPVSRLAFGAMWRDLAERRAFHVSEAPAVHLRHRRVAVIGDLNLPQCRKYRVEQMDEFWSGLDVDYVYSHYEDLPRCREILQQATHLVIYRLRSSAILSMHLYEARRLRVPVLYDIDDPLFSVSAYAGYSNMQEVSEDLHRHFLDEAPFYLDAMNAADVLSFSTPGLIDHAAGYSARPAFLRRNFADRETCEAGAAARRGVADRTPGFTVALASGSQGHDADTGVALDGLCAFLRAGDERRVLVLGHSSPELFPADLADRVEHVPFGTYPGYLRNLARADCVLMPLTDDVFNGCKSGVRVLDASAVGVPVLGSDVGDLPTVILDGRTGGIVSDGDWAGALERMAGDKAATRAMGLAARADLEARWTARSGEPVADPALARWVKG